jgi:hypothetical protein
MKQADLERHVRRMAWAEPRADLRSRVLTAAVIGPARITWSDRVWFSRGWRLAAVATAVGAIAIDSLWGTRDVPPVPPVARTLAEVQAIDDVGREIGLPEDLSASLARRTLIADSRRDASDAQGRLALEAVTREGERR